MSSHINATIRIAPDVAAAMARHRGTGAELTGLGLLMRDEELLKSIAAQLMTSTAVNVEGKSIPLRLTSRQRA